MVSNWQTSRPYESKNQSPQILRPYLEHRKNIYAVGAVAEVWQRCAVQGANPSPKADIAPDALGCPKPITATGLSLLSKLIADALDISRLSLSVSSADASFVKI